MAADPHLSWSDLEERMFMALFDEKRKPAEARLPMSELWGREVKTRRNEMLAAIRKLVAQGLLSVRPDETGAIDLRDPHALELTKRGHDYGLELVALADMWDMALDGDRRGGDLTPAPRPAFGLEGTAQSARAAPPAPAPIPAPATAADLDRAAQLEQQLAAMRVELERLKAAPPPPAPAPPPPPPATPRLSAAEVREAILREFHERERQQHGLVPIWQIRRAIAGVEAAEFDRILLALQREDMLALMKLNDARDVPEDQIRDGVKSAMGNKLYFVTRGERS